MMMSHDSQWRVEEGLLPVGAYCLEWDPKYRAMSFDVIHDPSAWSM